MKKKLQKKDKMLLCRKFKKFETKFMKAAAKYIFVLALLLEASSVWAANIAVVAPKVGPMAKFGHNLTEGVRTAVDDINQNGGIMGEQLNLITIDDQCEDSFAISAAQMMALNSSAEDRVSLVIGPYCGNAFARISQIYADGKIIRIVPVPVDKAQYNLNEPGLIKIGGVMIEEAEAFFRFYQKKFAGKNIAIAYESSLAAALETAYQVRGLFDENKLQNRLTLYDLDSYGGDYDRAAKEVLLNNQIVYILGSPSSTAMMAQKLQEENSETVLLIDEYMATPYFFREMGNFAEGVYVLAKEDLKDSPTFTEELVRLRLIGREPRGLGVYGYAAVKLWSDMALKAGSIAFEKVDAQRSGSKFRLPWGEVEFEGGRALQNSGYEVYQIVNGEYTQVD